VCVWKKVYLSYLHEEILVYLSYLHDEILFYLSYLHDEILGSRGAGCEIAVLECDAF
jgi:hypothetical protein